MKRIIIFIFLVIFTIVFFQNCDTTEPSSAELPDTTSQNFTFETYEFGDGYESSYFNDVWIFDEKGSWIYL